MPWVLKMLLPLIVPSWRIVLAEGLLTVLLPLNVHGARPAVGLPTVNMPLMVLPLPLNVLPVPPVAPAMTCRFPLMVLPLPVKVPK